MSRRVLITGGGGFVGQWLAKALLSRGDEVFLAGMGEPPRASRILTNAEWDALQWMSADVRNDSAVRAALDASLPELIIHLAGISSVSEAEQGLHSAYEVNVFGAALVATTAVRLRKSGKVDPLLLVVGSGMQYGRHDESAMPLTENAEQRPISVYAATKAAQEIACLQIGRASGLRVICTRSFNHSGPGHDPRTVVPSVIRRVRELKPGGTVQIGNDVVRDYLHVHDVVRAYLALAEKGAPGEAYNVCRGVGVRISDVTREVIARAGVEADVGEASELMRASDIPTLVGSPKKLSAATDWRPTKSYTDMIDDMLAVS